MTVDYEEEPSKKRYKFFNEEDLKQFMEEIPEEVHEQARKAISKESKSEKSE